MQINLIFARADNGIIGKDGVMPWHLPEDLAHFKELTQGRPVIMGRKTWDSLPERFRPLPDRLNIVVTRQEVWQDEGAKPATSLEDALEIASQSADTAWVMGGAQIYAQALPLAQRVEVTEIHQAFDGDVQAPSLGPEWKETARTDHVGANGLPFSFVTYEREAQPG
ncbi:dihydrofolate reductase [Diaphorobacter aerolatus]|uniref:Dihydrofolate reductase n=1 Tax=Diaphorobacter aerolatus TaxID=1288495 RepID=A0A7H0GIP1_9BURK|nr:dihydrofolate reductase [Diaphorobacter aerolatus]QNP48157.1 dihydrofolate reductase [Diaphorobacter aerolatus]